MKSIQVDSDKLKILQQFKITRDRISTLIYEEEIEKNWLTIHKTLRLAQHQIGTATAMMAKRHLRYCLLRSQPHLTLNTAQEIIKTFNYVG